ncbi:MAG TPA: GxxExxY protein [Terriglobales bacterium]|nr:GxxExxY protein [Terriglobales bacterium]
MEIDSLTDLIIRGALTVHRSLGPGYLESVYQNALVHELRKLNLDIACGVRLQVRYDGIVVGEFMPDIIVGGGLIIENKAIQAILTIHEVQLVNYLTATGIDDGLLLNFGAERLQIKRKFRLFRSGQEDRNKRTGGQEDRNKRTGGRRTGIRGQEDRRTGIRGQEDRRIGGRE